MLAFVELVYTDNSLICEFCVVIRAIEIAKDKGWNRLWIESDSLIVARVFSSSVESVDPWRIRDKWLSCLDSVANLLFCYIAHL